MLLKCALEAGLLVLSLRVDEFRAHLGDCDESAPLRNGLLHS